MARDRGGVGFRSHSRPSCIFSGVTIVAAQSPPTWRTSSMNWFGRRSSRGEEKFEAWIKRLHEQHVASGQAEPVGPHPSQDFLRDLAKRSPAISLSDARIDHAATCPNCMSRIVALRSEARERKRKLGYALVAIPCVVLVAALF